MKTKTIPYPALLITRRLRIQSASPSDSRILHRAVKESFPSLSRWLPWAQKEPTLEETKKFAWRSAALFMQREDYSFRIFLPQSRRFIGCIGLHLRDPKVPAFEIGYWLHSAHTGSGYMTEAVTAVADWGHRVAGARRILIRAQVPNKASWSIPKRLGFRFEGIQRNSIRDNFGKLADMKIYARTFQD